MKKLILSFFVAIMSIVAISCNESQAGGVNLIPSNASMVASINVGTLLTKGEISNTTIGSIDETLLSFVEATDINEPIYLYMTTNGEMGVIGKIKSIELVQKIIAEEFEDHTTKNQVGAFTVYSDDSQTTIVAENGSYYVVLISTSQLDGKVLSPKELIGAMTAENKAYENLKAENIAKLDSDSDIALIMNTSKPMNVAMTTPYDASALEELGDMISLVTMNFENGSIDLSSEILYVENKALANLASKVSGEYDKFLPVSPVMYSAVSLAPKKSLAFLFDMYVKMIEDMTVQYGAPIGAEEFVEGVERAEQYVELLNGDIVLSVGQSLTDIILLAKVKDNSILEMVNEDLREMGIVSPKRISDTEYSISMMMFTINYGIHNGTFYISSMPQALEALKAGKALSMSFEQSSFIKDNANSYGLMLIDIKTLLSNPMIAMLMGSGASNIPFVRAIDRMEAVNSSPTSGKVKVFLNDDTQNSLKLIISELSEL